MCPFVRLRANREGWPLLTVETEVNGDSNIGLVMPIQENFFFLGCSVGPVQNIFSSLYTIPFLCPHRPASWAGSRVGRLSLVRLTARPTSPHHCKLNTKTKREFFNYCSFSRTRSTMFVRCSLVQESLQAKVS